MHYKRILELVFTIIKERPGKVRFPETLDVFSVTVQHSNAVSFSKHLWLWLWRLSFVCYEWSPWLYIQFEQLQKRILSETSAAL